MGDSASQRPTDNPQYTTSKDGREKGRAEGSLASDPIFSDEILTDPGISEFLSSDTSWSDQNFGHLGDPMTWPYDHNYWPGIGDTLMEAAESMDMEVHMDQTKVRPSVRSLQSPANPRGVAASNLPHRTRQGISDIGQLAQKITSEAPDTTEPATTDPPNPSSTRRVTQPTHGNVAPATGRRSAGRPQPPSATSRNRRKMVPK
ncbi:hypothetical protein BDW62DRAFT_204544 [Aspergillus aurantiobrunneus]